jgi:cytochrome c
MSCAFSHGPRLDRSPIVTNKVPSAGMAGPTLFGIFGKAAAVGDEMFPYSQALKDSKLVWNAATLDRFLTNPMATVPGTAMPMPVPEKKDRDNIIAYFQSLIGGAK